jgi:methionyl-tRNA formyltransferase
MPRSKIVIIGNGTLACKGLQALSGCVDVPLVVADTRDSGTDTWRLSLIRIAREMGFKDGETLLQPRNPNDQEVIEKIKGIGPDVILSLQCRQIIRERLFSLPRLATLNLHNAPLPLLRGCDPFGWAIHDGLKQMGVTLHRILDEGVDNGPVVCQSLWSISNDTTAWDLYQEGIVQAVEMLREFFSFPLKEGICGVVQDERHVTYHPMGQFDFSEMEIDWNMTAEALSAWIRARIFPPFHLPFFLVNGHKAEIRCCSKSDIKGIPGTVMNCSPLTIAAKLGSIKISSLRVNGQEMDPANAVRLLKLATNQMTNSTKVIDRVDKAGRRL